MLTEAKSDRLLAVAGGGGLVEVFLKAGEDVADFVGLAEVGHGVGNRVVLLEPEQGCQFLLVELLHADGDVVGEDKIEEHMLFGAETGVDIDPRVGRANLTTERGHGVGHMRQNIEQVALLCAMTIILPIQCQLKFPVAPVYLCVVFHCLFHCL